MKMKTKDQRLRLANIKIEIKHRIGQLGGIASSIKGTDQGHNLYRIGEIIADLEEVNHKIENLENSLKGG
jgi:hypothetical protein